MGAFFIISNENLHLNNPDELHEFFNFYYAWFGDIFQNINSLSGYVIQSGWLPQTESLEVKNISRQGNVTNITK